MFPPRTAMQNSVQSFPPPNSAGAGPLLIEYNRGPLLPPRGTKQRDWQLRIVDNHPYSSMWQGARSGIIKKLSGVAFAIDGPPAQVQYFQDVLGYAHFGKGWEYLLKLIVRDFLSQSYGGIFEIAGPGDPTSELLEAPTGLNHLDAGRCYVTGNPIYPLLYYSLWDGRLHKMHASRVYMMVDDPDPDERYFGIGTCALERAIAINQRELRMGQYIDALLDDKPQPGLLSLTGVSGNNWQELVVKYMMEQQNDERPVFGRTLVLTSLDPNAAVKAEVIPFSQTPEKFDFIKYTDLDVSALALALGIDRQELWELAGRGLGSGSQSAVLSMKSRAKLYGDVLSGLERFMNWAFLPEDCEFKFVEDDPLHDVTQAGIDLQLSQIAGAMASIPGITSLEVKTFLAHRSDSFKDALTDAHGNITVPSQDPVTPQQALSAPVDNATPVAASTAAPQPSPRPALPSGQQAAALAQKGLETEGQRAWFFANNPQFSSAGGDFPKLQEGYNYGHTIGPHELKKGDNYYHPGNSRHGQESGTVTRVNPKTVKYQAEASYMTFDPKTGKNTYGPHMTEYTSGHESMHGGYVQRGSKVHPIKFDYGMKELTAKAFSATAADFEVHFTDIVTRAVDGRIRRNQAENLLLGLLLSSGTKAFGDGLAQGGVTDELDDSDQGQIQNLVADAIDYLDPLLDAAYGGTLSAGDVETRAILWSNKTLTDFLNAGRISADRNGTYKWVLGETDRHCPDCARLAGQVHRFGRWYEKGLLPQGSALDCGGWRCKCRLVKTGEPAQGRF